LRRRSGTVPGVDPHANGERSEEAAGPNGPGDFLPESDEEQQKEAGESEGGVRARERVRVRHNNAGGERKKRDKERLSHLK
jgi:hypothetical protein